MNIQCTWGTPWSCGEKVRKVIMEKRENANVRVGNQVKKNYGNLRTVDIILDILIIGYTYSAISQAIFTQIHTQFRQIRSRRRGLGF